MINLRQKEILFEFEIYTYLPLLADRKSHKRSSVASQVVLASRLAGRRPRVSLLLMDEPHFFYSSILFEQTLISWNPALARSCLAS